MIIAGVYSFNRGKEVIESQLDSELQEVRGVIAAVDSQAHKGKPGLLKKAFRKEFEARQWQTYRVRCQYPTEYYVPGYTPTASTRGAFRAMDFLKNRVGIEVQFGKYSFMVYNVCAKMTIFHEMDVIDVGIEIVPIKAFANQMSTGVSYFEQFVWDLEHRGVADIDIPVLILGIDA
jgi:hypothetical protein